MKRNFELRIRLTAEEKQRVEKKCSELGLSLSAFTRLLLLNSKIEVTSAD